MRDETEELKQALSLARNNRAAMRVVLVYPELPKNLGVYRETLEDLAGPGNDTAIQTALAALNMSGSRGAG